MSHHIRSATPADRPRLLAIQSASLASTWPELLETAITGPGRVLVSGQTAVGYALAVGSDPTHLAELAVAPGYRNAGHGSALLKAVLDNDDDCRLTARADDERARRFYERHGFRLDRFLPDHYEHGDGVAMVYQSDDRS
ncbi:GNAT family N-acetyltransferase [Halococcus thailandensis]|uniref:Pab N-terminal acetyltransferase n=1 Tax=Halococcus thailandensis JCM 13552 TaxID=1227457 RepID=M0MYR7_9EURY|nr:N-acetyltransferase [Halococcus thailandensis]EMA50458.1 Pab N-terminal acetyltransferase [Halococcus thailandensis JCM 13552]